MTMRQSEPIGTGQEIALAMARHFPGQDWVAELAERSGRSRDTVEWHLQQEMTPPAAMTGRAAAVALAPPLRRRRVGAREPRLLQAALASRRAR